MSSTSAISIAPKAGLPVELRLSSGKTYTLSPLRVRHIAQWEAWVAGFPLEIIRSQADGRPVEEKRFLLELAYKDSATGDYGLGTPRANAAMASVRGAVYLLWLLARVHHADLTFEQLADDIGVDDMEAVRRALDQAAGHVADPSSASSAEQPGTRLTGP